MLHCSCYSSFVEKLYIWVMCDEIYVHISTCIYNIYENSNTTLGDDLIKLTNQFKIYVFFIFLVPKDRILILALWICHASRTWGHMEITRFLKWQIYYINNIKKKYTRKFKKIRRYQKYTPPKFNNF
jgi:hypothetical protein